MEIYHIWLIVAIILVIVEIFTAAFGAVCFAVGAAASAIAASLDATFTWQIAIFAIVSFIIFAFLRPVVLRFLNKKSEDVKTNAEALVGKTAIVSERIDTEQHTGRVAIDGDDWKAISEDNSVIEKGTAVEVTKIESIIVTVKIK